MFGRQAGSPSVTRPGAVTPAIFNQASSDLGAAPFQMLSGGFAIARNKNLKTSSCTDSSFSCGLEY